MQFRPAPRPESLPLVSLAQLYSDFERLFLRGEAYRAEWTSSSGHELVVMDRHFLHLVKLRRLETDGTIVDFFPDIQKEKPLIRGCDSGFSAYLVMEHRCKLLPTALDTMCAPHAVIKIGAPQSAELAFFKYFGGKQNPALVVLVGRSEREGDLIPLTAYPIRRNQMKTWFKHPNVVIWSDDAATVKDSDSIGLNDDIGETSGGA